MAGSAGWWRGDSSFQAVGIGLSFLVLGFGELEDSSSERLSLDAETELRVLKSRTQRVPPLDFGTSVSELYLWHGFDSFYRDFTPFGHLLMYDKRFFLSFRGCSMGHHIHANLDELRGLLMPLLSSFLGNKFWPLFPAKSQRGQGAKIENLGPFAVKVGPWQGIKLFLIFQR